MSSKYRARLRERLCEAQNWRCAYCGIELLYDVKYRREAHPKAPTFDHIKPTSKGGKDSVHNLIIACYSCNHRRGNMPAMMFYERVTGKSYKPFAAPLGEIARFR